MFLKEFSWFQLCVCIYIYTLYIYIFIYLFIYLFVYLFIHIYTIYVEYFRASGCFRDLEGFRALGLES